MDAKNNRSAIYLDAFGLFIAGFNNTILALLVAVFIHGPGTASGQPDLMLRATWIAEHATLWKAGWLFWFAPTLSFSWSYYALGRHLDRATHWRNLAVAVAVIAAAVDIVGVLLNLTVLPEIAKQLAGQAAAQDGSLQTVFVAFEKFAFNLTNVGGYGLYSLAGILLLPSVFAKKEFWRPLAWLGVAEWGISMLAAFFLVVSPPLATVPLVISFLLFAPWVWGSALWVLRGRPER